MKPTVISLIVGAFILVAFIIVPTASAPTPIMSMENCVLTSGRNVIDLKSVVAFQYWYYNGSYEVDLTLRGGSNIAVYYTVSDRASVEAAWLECTR